jgi:RNA polymerase sigma-70 factor (ECF subfamily)
MGSNGPPPHDCDAVATPGEYERFLAVFTLAQGRLQSYIRSLVHDRAAADDVFQTTALELWQKFSAGTEINDFTAWSLGVARHKVLHYWRSKRRDRHVFSDDVLSSLADASLACVESLPDRQRQLVSLFYGEQWPAEAIAAQWNRSVHAVYKALKLLRKTLLTCIEARLAPAGPSQT